MIQKKHIKSRKSCKLIFVVPPEELPEGIEIQTLAIAGNFNDWDPEATLLEANRDGNYRAVIEVPEGEHVRFRYLANGEIWFNAWQADGYAPNGFGEENCVVVAAD